jgi:hypothetical protein
MLHLMLLLALLLVGSFLHVEDVELLASVRLAMARAKMFSSKFKCKEIAIFSRDILK